MSDLFGITEETSEMQEANARESAEMLAEATRNNPEEPEDISMDNDVDDPEIEPDEEGGRNEKKASRPGLMRALEDSRKREEESQKREAALNERLARLEGHATATMQAQHAGALDKQEDPIQKGIDQTFDDEDSLKREAEAVYGAAARGEGTADKKTQEDFNKRHHKITQHRIELVNMKSNRDNGIRPVDPQEGVQAALRAQYPDIYSNPQAHAFVQSRYGTYRSLGYPDTPELVKTVMAEGRKQFNLRQQGGAAPSEAMRAKYQGISGGGAQGAPSKKGTVRMTPDMKSIAETHYEHRDNLTAREKHQLWAKEIGPAFLRANSQEG